MLSSKFIMIVALATGAILLAHVAECGRSAGTRQRSASPKKTTASTNNVATSANGSPGTTKRTVSKDGGTVTTESASDRVSPDGRSRSSSRASTTTSSSVSPISGGRRPSFENGNKRSQDRPQTSTSATAKATSSTNGPNSTVSTTANGTPGTVKKTVNKDGSTTLESTIENISLDGKSYSKTFSSNTMNSRP